MIDTRDWGLSGVGYWHMCRMSSRSCGHVSYLMVCLRAFVTSLQEHPRLLTHKIEGADRELRKSEDATHFATDGPAPRRYDGDTAAARACRRLCPE